MKGARSMTALETSRLIDWLKAHGHTDEEATQCIKCIAGVLDPLPPVSPVPANDEKQ